MIVQKNCRIDYKGSVRNIVRAELLDGRCPCRFNNNHGSFIWYKANRGIDDEHAKELNDTRKAIGVLIRED